MVGERPMHLRQISSLHTDREKLPPLHQSILDAAVDFPTVEVPSRDSKAQEPKDTTKKTTGSKQPTSKEEAENKLARLLKLQPRK
jgi:hypothetical protein